jgi:SPP1 family predicted phage head-tail adaptor
MNSGDLRHRIELQAVVKVADGMGGTTNSFLTVATVNASLWPISGTEQMEGGRLTAVITHRIRIRFRRGVKASWRVKDLFSGKYYSIVTAPIDLGDNHQFLEFMAKEVV